MYIPLSSAPSSVGKMRMTVVTGTHSTNNQLASVTFSYMHFITHYNCHSASSDVMTSEVGLGGLCRYNFENNRHE